MKMNNYNLTLTPTTMKYYEGTGFVCGRRYYEVELMQRVKGGLDNEYETTEMDYTTSTYWEARKVAKDCAMNWYGKASTPYGEFTETDSCVEGLAMAKIICYTAIEDEGWHEELFAEYYYADGTKKRINY
jgi:hypothetical protein